MGEEKQIPSLRCGMTQERLHRNDKENGSLEFLCGFMGLGWAAVAEAL